LIVLSFFEAGVWLYFARTFCLRDCQFLLFFQQTWLMNRAQDSIAARLRKEVFESLLTNRELEWFQHAQIEETKDSEKKKGGEKSDSTSDDSKETSDKSKEPTTSSDTGITPAAVGVIMKDDVEVVANTVTNTLANLLRSSSSCIFGTYNMLRINPQLVGLSIAVAPVVGTIALLTRKYLKKIVALQQEAAISSASFVEERLNHIAMVKTSNREQDEVEKYNQIQDECVSLGGKAAVASGLSMGIMFGLSSTAFCGILLAGRRAVKAEKMTSGQLTSFGTYSFMLALGTAGVVRAMGEYSTGMQCAARLYKLIDNESAGEEQAPKQEAIKMAPDVNTDLVQKLSVENVCFSYKADPSKVILEDLSFSLSRGEVVALVGKNGSGKSTAASILAGMYLPQAGEISLYNNNAGSEKSLNYITDVERNDQVNLVQVVPQAPAIFNTSILDNVRYSCPDASEEDVGAALKSANCDFVSKLEGGLEYQVGRNGIRLSGGQRQRIGLARAFLVNPVFLVLDEPSSAMDAEGELALKDTMKACRASNRGLLIITHRAKTLELADRILVLKDGKIAEDGKLEKLQKLKNGELVSLMSDLD
jgi:ABC-type multidrug transport system fused ATPase/permease subunit